MTDKRSPGSIRGESTGQWCSHRSVCQYQIPAANSMGPYKLLAFSVHGANHCPLLPDGTANSCHLKNSPCTQDCSSHLRTDTQDKGVTPNPGNKGCVVPLRAARCGPFPSGWGPAASTGRQRSRRRSPRTALCRPLRPTTPCSRPRRRNSNSPAQNRTALVFF